MIKSCLTTAAALAFCLLLTACTDESDPTADAQPRKPPAQPLQAPSGPGGGAGMTAGGEQSGTGQTGGSRTGG